MPHLQHPEGVSLYLDSFLSNAVSLKSPLLSAPFSFNSISLWSIFFSDKKLFFFSWKILTSSPPSSLVHCQTEKKIMKWKKLLSQPLLFIFYVFWFSARILSIFSCWVQSYQIYICHGKNVFLWNYLWRENFVKKMPLNSTYQQIHHLKKIKLNSIRNKLMQKTKVQVH